MNNPHIDIVIKFIAYCGQQKKGLALLAALIWINSSALFAQVNFIDVSKKQGITFSYGSGAPIGGTSFCDFNLDGLDDITLASGKDKTIAFYVNNGDEFTLLDPPPVSNTNEIKQVLWIDFDNDGDKDLYLASLDSKNYLYRNNGNLQLEDITVAAGLSTETEPSYGAAWGDLDRDGWLDLFATSKKIGLENVYSTNRLYRNLGNGTFEEITISSGILDNTKSPFCASFIDFDNDLWPDIYVAQDKTARNSLFVNQHNAKFKDSGEATNSDIAMFGMSVATADIDNDGTFEIYITNTVGNKLLLNHHFAFTEEGHHRGVDFIGGTGWGASFLDVENDGDQDLYVSGMFVGSHAVSSAFYENDGLGNFIQPNAGFVGDTVSSYSNAIGDLNDDGYPDIIVNNAEPFHAQLWQNAGGINNWIKIKLKGVLSNRDGIGSRIEVYTSGTKQSYFTQTAVSFLGQNSDWTFFGLATADAIDSIYVNWPSGHTEKLYDVTANQKMYIEETAFTPWIPKLNFSGIQKRCAGDSIQLNASFFNNQTTYLWSTGETTSEINVKNSGSYSVQINSPYLPGNSWHSPSVNIEFEINESPSIDVSVSSVSCFGEDDGSIELGVIGGSPPYSILWRTGETELELNNLEPGFYQVSITDNEQCEVLGNFVVEEPEPIILLHDIIEISFGKFAIVVNRFGGVSPYTYSWSVSGAANNASLSNLDPGEYSVIVTDANGCKASGEFVIDKQDIITSFFLDRRIDIVLYPNPVDKSLTIRFSELGNKCLKFRFTNLQGQSTEMLRCISEDEVQIQPSLLSHGLNHLQISSDNEIIYWGKVLVR